MDNITFSDNDFNVFKIDGLDQRMNAIKETIRPKLVQLGHQISPFLSVLVEEEIYSHVAKHARRTVNPPNDTWVAWSTSKKGYKALPHFQVGLWSTHLFIWFAMIYEAPNKSTYGEQLLDQAEQIIHQIPKNYVWSIDHTKPQAITHQFINKEEIEEMSEKLIRIKKSELLCGLHIDRNDPILQDSTQLLKKIEDTFKHLIPLYKLAKPL